ncbi:MAG: cytochrome c oxidase subunit II [Actinomycetota bacterium]
MKARVAIGLFLGACFTSACSDHVSPSVLDPAGPGARRIEGLWWLMFWISAVVFVVTVAMIGYAVFQARRNKPQPEARWAEGFVVVAGAIVPSLILAGVFVLSLRDTSALSSGAQRPDLVVEVTAHDWWWEVVYEDDGVIATTANEIHIPAGRRVELRLESVDVIHSLWVPRLQAKTDMTPGKTTRMWLEADEPGTYRGQCAEFCGLQHANMIFFVIAEEPTEFEEWLEEQTRDAVVSGTDGEEVFLSSTCVGCHTIRGTSADSSFGPDLTHLASRTTIASGVLANNRTNLTRWIVDPQGVKPGAAMPPTELSSDELITLLDYLESLR